jgi:hypothetical protein
MRETWRPKGVRCYGRADRGEAASWSRARRVVPNVRGRFSLHTGSAIDIVE